MGVEKLGPPIPECGLISVTFENDPSPAAKTVTLSKVFRHAPYEKIRPFTSGVENPRQHRRGGGLSMSSAADDRMSFREKHFLQHFRHRSIRNLSVQNLLELWISTRDDIAD